MIDVPESRCCDLCNPSLFDQTRPSKPTKASRQAAIKKGDAVESVRSALFEWRRSIKRELYSKALWAPQAILDDTTCELLSSIGPVTSEEQLEKILKTGWARWEKLGHRLFEFMVTLDIPPIPIKTRAKPSLQSAVWPTTLLGSTPKQVVAGSLSHALSDVRGPNNVLPRFSSSPFTAIHSSVPPMTPSKRPAPAPGPSDMAPGSIPPSAKRARTAAGPQSQSDEYMPMHTPRPPYTPNFVSQTSSTSTSSFSFTTPRSLPPPYVSSQFISPGTPLTQPPNSRPRISGPTQLHLPYQPPSFQVPQSQSMDNEGGQLAPPPISFPASNYDSFFASFRRP